MTARSAASLLATLLVIVVIAAAGVLVAGPRRADSPRALPTLTFATPEKDAFRRRFRPLVERAAAEAAALVALGESRERNLLRIRAAQTEMNAALDAADAWLATHPPPAADQPAVAAYREGASAVRMAMAEALAGFFRFDFDRVAEATRTMQDGADALHHAIWLLDGQDADGTPAAGAGTISPAR